MPNWFIGYGLLWFNHANITWGFILAVWVNLISGVATIINKNSGLPFDEFDQELFEVSSYESPCYWIKKLPVPNLPVCLCPITFEGFVRKSDDIWARNIYLPHDLTLLVISSFFWEREIFQRLPLQKTFRMGGSGIDVRIATRISRPTKTEPKNQSC